MTRQLSHVQIVTYLLCMTIFGGDGTNFYFNSATLAVEVLSVIVMQG